MINNDLLYSCVTEAEGIHILIITIGLQTDCYTMVKISSVQFLISNIIYNSVGLKFGLSE